MSSRSKQATSLQHVQAVAATHPSDTQDIETLRSRYDELRDAKTTAEANLNTARKQLKELQEQAREQFETDDIGELKAKLENMKRDNEQKRAHYQEALDSIECEVKAIDEKYHILEENELGDS